MTIDEITTTLRAFARSRKSGCRACPEYNSCGKIGCRMAEEAANLIEMQRREVGYVYAMRRTPDEDEYGCVGIADDVTHWMELPEAQKEENNGRC